MTDNLVFDTDCISSFLWVGEEKLLTNLYPGQMILPKQVFYELSNPCIPHLGLKIEQLCSSGDLRLSEILFGSEEYELYCQLALSPPKGETVIGKGEAAAIVLARSFNAILASNNLKDVSKYVVKFGLKHFTTGEILIEALNKGYIDVREGDTIWQKMLSKRRFLPINSFSSFFLSKNS
ncbi:MAG: hypothetical protein WC224_05170 [Sphaerochaetaceae bacterium]